MFFTYILISIKDNSYYYGHSYTLEKRLHEHNSGKVKYTKPKRPWMIHYYEKFNTRSESIQKELFFKPIEGYRWLKKNQIT